MKREYQKQNTTARRTVAAAYDWISTLISSLLILVVLFTFFLGIVRVDGWSMVSTLYNDDRLLLVAAAEYDRGDIVVIDRYTIDPIIKRVIAVGGDTIEILPEGIVVLNGKILNEPYVKGLTPQKDCKDAVVVPEGYVFVMGDNRSVSLDSRTASVGLVLEKDIVGKAVFRVLPITSFGKIYDNTELN